MSHPGAREIGQVLFSGHRLNYLAKAQGLAVMETETPTAMAMGTLIGGLSQLSPLGPLVQ